jgi:hypothetical protein
MSVEQKINSVYDLYVKPRIKKDSVTIDSYRNGTLYLNINKKVKDREFLLGLVNLFISLVPEVNEVKRSDYTDVLPALKDTIVDIGIEVEALNDWKEN